MRKTYDMQSFFTTLSIISIVTIIVISLLAGFATYDIKVRFGIVDRFIISPIGMVIALIASTLEYFILFVPLAIAGISVATVSHGVLAILLGVVPVFIGIAKKEKSSVR